MIFEQECLIAKARDIVLGMRHEHDGAAGCPESIDYFEALVLKRMIADCQDFIDQENIGVELRRNGEAQSRNHTFGIESEGQVDRVLQFRKFDNRVQSASYGGSAKPENDSV